MDIRVADKVRNEELRRRSGLEDAVTAAHLLKWWWGTTRCQNGSRKMDSHHNSLGPENWQKKQSGRQK